jgi:Rrf2 family protein
VKISTKGQYALEALMDLQLHAVDGQETLRNIAVRRGISEHYLEQIFALLRKAGIVESIRGAQGGYRLAREPRSITAGEIIRSAEGPLYSVKCIGNKAEDENMCPMIDRCVTRPLWARITAEIDSIIDGITLLDLTDSCASLAKANTQEYCI